MCGILGYTHNSKRLPSGVLTSALNSLEHRGPNHQGRFVSERISLGSVRLRILDLDGGDQPLYSPDQNVVVVFNGEIFNHRELRDELIAEGFSFATSCDTEVVLNAFLRWGEAGFSKFRGMFAIALWIQSERRLLLVRDRMGIKPLYYYLQAGEIYFGSELKCIFAHPAVPRRICLHGLNCFLSLNYVPGPYTLVEGITKLMPGTLLEWQNGHSSVRGYLSTPKAAPPIRDLGDACAELDELLKQAVGEQLVSDVPSGLWLSGGLDSSTILHYAANAQSTPLRTFSVTFRGRSFDESSTIKELSSHYGTTHSEFDLAPSIDLAGAIEQMAFHSDEPSADAGALPVWLLSQWTRKDVTMVLSGDGSDELFAGYLTYKADRYCAAAQRLPVGLRKAALALATRLPVSDDKISFEYKLKRFLQGSLLSPERAHIFWNGTFSDAEKRRLFLFTDPNPLAEMLAHMKTRRGLQRYLDFDQQYYLPDDILYKVDRMSMAHSLEVRPPFLDPRIVDFAARLPENFKLHGSKSKYILRRLMGDRLPPSIMRQPKIGFDIPIHDWFRGALRPLLLDTLSQEAVSDSKLFRWNAVENLLQEHLERKANRGYHLWGLMILLIWMKRWSIEPPSDRATRSNPLLEALDGVGSLSQSPASFTS